ncbi:type IV pilus secretin PilQ family protein [Alteromonadaceae bacterium M269]|nr:type IV pilus secretin PilQ family protein [Alteromonadaceae bacterium M269]
MSERFIFNKKLNRKPKQLWFLLLLSLLAIATVKSYAQESDTKLVTLDSGVAQYTNQLNNIDFKRTVDGGAKLSLSFDNTSYDAKLQKTSNGFELALPKTRLADDQLLKMDVTDFATPVSIIESFQLEEAAQLVIDADLYTVAQQRDGNTLIVDVYPITQAEAAEQEKVESFTGEPISLDFQDVPVRQVLQIIAQVNGFNLVTTDTVNGNITISLSDVPWDQALNVILKIKGLDKRFEGNILLIAPAEELLAQETQQLQSKAQVAELAPLVSSSIQINYAKAADMATILSSAEGSILSPRGSVTVDERTNTLLVRDTQASIDQARSTVESLDIPVKQVLIESRIVTVLDNVDEQLGVRWGISDRNGDDGVSGTIEGAGTIAGGTIPTLAERLNVNLPVTGAAGSIGIQVARLVDGTILDLELSALEAENKGEVVASPRITVANQHESYIEQGTEIPFVQATSSGATSVEFKKAVLSLRATPQITPDNRIILDLVVTQDTQGETVQTSTGPAVAIDTQEISTQVLVENGETIVLGGIFQQTTNNNTSQVPLLGDLPVVGRLFKNTQEEIEKRELLIFVTPKILTDDL